MLINPHGGAHSGYNFVTRVIRITDYVFRLDEAGNHFFTIVALNRYILIDATQAIILRNSYHMIENTHVPRGPCYSKLIC